MAPIARSLVVFQASRAVFKYPIFLFFTLLLFLTGARTLRACFIYSMCEGGCHLTPCFVSIPYKLCITTTSVCICVHRSSLSLVRYILLPRPRLRFDETVVIVFHGAPGFAPDAAARHGRSCHFRDPCPVYPTDNGRKASSAPVAKSPAPSAAVVTEVGTV